MHGPRKFCQRGSNLDNFFFRLMSGERMAFRWRADDGETLNAGSIAL